MNNKFSNLEFPDNASVVTPSDSEEFDSANIIYVGSGGDVAVKTYGGDTVTFAGIQTGAFLPVAVVQVLATGTTASDIVRCS